MLNSKQYENFGKTFLEKYLANGFGTLPKREIDVLVFHLISEAAEIKGKSNYEVANKLKVTESKIKSLKLEASLKHNQPKHKDIIKEIVTQLTNEIKKLEFADGYVTLSLEDPVYKREFEYAIKNVGYYVEYGFNNEILKIKPLQLLEVILNNIENGEQEFIKLVKAHIKEAEKQNEIISKALSFKQKLSKFGKELNNNSGLLGLVVQAGTLL